MVIQGSSYYYSTFPYIYLILFSQIFGRGEGVREGGREGEREGGRERERVIILSSHL